MSRIIAGIHPRLDFKSVNFEEESLIRQFAKVWFITFIKSAHFKDGEFTYAFGKPSTELTERFHFEREVLILFSAYKTFDARALDFVDKTIFEFQN